MFELPESQFSYVCGGDIQSIEGAIFGGNSSILTAIETYPVVGSVLGGVVVVAIGTAIVAEAAAIVICAYGELKEYVTTGKWIPFA